MTTRDHLRLLWRRRWLLLGVMAACLAIAVGCITLATPVYEARATLVVTSDRGTRSSVLAAAAPLLSMIGEPVSALGGADRETQVQIITSRPSLQAAWGLLHEHPDLLALGDLQSNPDAVVEQIPEVLAGLGPQPPPVRWPEPYQALLDTLYVGIVEDSDLIEVRCESTDPELSRDFVNALVLAYLGRSLADARSATRRTREYIQDEIERVEARLAEAEASLREFGRRVGTVALDESARQQIGLLARLTEQAALAQSTMKAQDVRREELSERLASVEGRIEQTTTIMRAPEIAELQAALAKAEAEWMSLLEEYTPDSMPVRRAAARVEELRAQLASTSAEVIGSRQETINPLAQQLMQEIVVAEGEATAARESWHVLNEAVQRIEAALADLPQDQVLLLRLQREIELLERMYLALKEREQEYEIAERTRTPASRLNEAAIAAEEPVRPKRTVSIAAGVVAGLLLGLLVVGWAEHFDDGLHEPERAAHLLGLPVIAALRRDWAPGSPADPEVTAALEAILAQIRVARASSYAQGVVASVECAAEAERLGRALAGLAAEQGDHVLLATGDSTGLTEAAEQHSTLIVGDGVTHIGLGETPLVRQKPERIKAALDAAGADLVLAVTADLTGLISAEPLLEVGWPLVVCIDLRRTRRVQAESIVRFARDRGATLLGTIVLGARRSGALYCPPS